MTDYTESFVEGVDGAARKAGTECYVEIEEESCNYYEDFLALGRWLDKERDRAGVTYCRPVAC